MSVIFHINRITIVCNLKVPAKLNIGLRIWQVFPLLIEKFSFEEQASLVWQFLCSIPVSMMAEFLPWLSSSISSDECQDMRKCLSRVIPEEKLLQQVSALSLCTICLESLSNRIVVVIYLILFCA